MKIENPEEILEWDTEKLWNAVNIIKQEIGAEPRGYKKAKDGIRIYFPIYYITNKWYETYPSAKRAAIFGYGKVSIQDFMKEIEDRDTIMRNIIMEHIEDDEAIKPRV